MNYDRVISMRRGNNLSQRNPVPAVVLLAILVGCFTAPATAAPAGFAEGVRAYQARRFNIALEQFTRAARSAPNDATVHYYLGLCYQSTNQVSLAKQQYDWVVSCSPIPSLRSQASLALSQLSKFSITRAGAVASPLSDGSRSAADGAAKLAAAADVPKLNGRLRLIEFYTDH